jgi:hypothetical protein
MKPKLQQKIERDAGSECHVVLRDMVSRGKAKEYCIATATPWAEQCEKLLEALHDICGNRCAIGINPCAARDAIEEFNKWVET